MAILHMINKAELGRVKHFISFNDSALFLQNSLAHIEELNLDVQNRYILLEDLTSNNLTKQCENLKLTAISYAELVDLTLEFDKTILWN